MDPREQMRYYNSILDMKENAGLYQTMTSAHTDPRMKTVLHHGLADIKKRMEKLQCEIDKMKGSDDIAGRG